MQISTQEPLSLDDAAEAGAVIVSCADNPRDFRPARDAILQRAKDIGACLRQRVAIIIGEEHSIPTHKALAIGVLDELPNVKAD
ncbi:MAG TPA: hypothetical protein VIF12_05285 [Micavibrio sp.]